MIFRCKKNFFFHLAQRMSFFLYRKIKKKTWGVCYSGVKHEFSSGTKIDFFLIETIYDVILFVLVLQVLMQPNIFLQTTKNRQFVEEGIFEIKI